jgi:hypothetical protein
MFELYKERYDPISPFLDGDSHRVVVSGAIFDNGLQTGILLIYILDFLEKM